VTVGAGTELVGGKAATDCACAVATTPLSNPTPVLPILANWASALLHLSDPNRIALI
jgi:hypothetical protein